MSPQGPPNLQGSVLLLTGQEGSRQAGVTFSPLMARTQRQFRGIYSDPGAFVCS